jgi:hypothetical protein
MESRPARRAAAASWRAAAFAFFAVAVAVAGLPAASARAAALPPARQLALRLEADSLAAAGAADGAIAAYERLLAADSTDYEATWRLAQLLRRAGRMDEAITYGLRAYRAGFADREATTCAVARWHAAAGRTDEALAWLERCVAAPMLERPELKTDEAFTAMRDDPRFRALAGFGPAGERSRVEGWRDDLAFFVTEARRMHAAPARPTHDPAFEADVEALAARVPALDDVAVAIELQRLIVKWLADGHSALMPMPTERVPFSILPLRPWFVADGLYVIDATPEFARLVGRRITAIGGKPVDRIVDDLAPYVSRDNAQGILAMGTLYLRVPALLRAMGYAQDLEQVSFTTVDERGRSETVTVGPGGHDLPHGLVPPPAAGGAPTPASLAHVGETAWLEARPDIGAVYAQLNQVRNPEGSSLTKFAAQVRDELRRSGAKTLILDLRHNRGGNNFLIWPLVRLAAWHETEGPGRRTFVITGRATFSACQNLVNQLDRGTNAIFVGEPAGSRPNFTGEDTWVELPWSKLRISISARYWQDSWPTDERPWVGVAMPVAMTAADWKAGRDPVMDALGVYLAGR